MTPRNYESLSENVIKIAERLKGRVDSGQIRSISTSKGP